MAGKLGQSAASSFDDYGDQERNSWLQWLQPVPFSTHSPAVLLPSIRQPKKAFNDKDLLILNLHSRFHLGYLGFWLQLNLIHPGCTFEIDGWGKSRWHALTPGSQEERNQPAPHVLMLPTKPHPMGNLISPSWVYKESFHGHRISGNYLWVISNES